MVSREMLYFPFLNGMDHNMIIKFKHINLKHDQQGGKLVF